MPVRSRRPGIPIRTIAATAVAVMAGGAVALSSAASAQSSGAVVDERVRTEISAHGSAGFWVVLRDQADLSAAHTMRDRDARGAYVAARLMSTAASAQRRVRAFLDARHIAYR